MRDLDPRPVNDTRTVFLELFEISEVRDRYAGHGATEGNQPQSARREILTRGKDRVGIRKSQIDAGTRHSSSSPSQPSRGGDGNAGRRLLSQKLFSSAVGPYIDGTGILFSRI